jgi:hypothetical protein
MRPARVEQLKAHRQGALYAREGFACRRLVPSEAQSLSLPASHEGDFARVCLNTPTQHKVHSGLVWENARRKGAENKELAHKTLMYAREGFACRRSLPSEVQSLSLPHQIRKTLHVYVRIPAPNTTGNYVCSRTEQGHDNRDLTHKSLLHTHGRLSLLLSGPVNR